VALGHLWGRAARDRHANGPPGTFGFGRRCDARRFSIKEFLARAPGNGRVKNRNGDMRCPRNHGHLPSDRRINHGVVALMTDVSAFFCFISFVRCVARRYADPSAGREKRKGEKGKSSSRNGPRREGIRRWRAIDRQRHRGTPAAGWRGPPPGIPWLLRSWRPVPIQVRIISAVGLCRTERPLSPIGRATRVLFFCREAAMGTQRARLSATCAGSNDIVPNITVLVKELFPAYSGRDSRDVPRGAKRATRGRRRSSRQRCRSGSGQRRRRSRSDRPCRTFGGRRDEAAEYGGIPPHPVTAEAVGGRCAPGRVLGPGRRQGRRAYPWCKVGANKTPPNPIHVNDAVGITSPGAHAPARRFRKSRNGSKALRPCP